MREIKFRAWDKEAKRMIIHEQDFIPLKVTNVGVLKLDPCMAEARWMIVDVNRFELMQYIGFPDKNGKEIYVNDIVNIEYDTVNGYGENVSNCKENVVVTWDYELLCQLQYDRAGIEIIGNIYENPELLEE